MQPFLNINIYERGVAGVPGTVFVTDLRDRVDSYQHTMSDQFGFESMQVTLGVTLDEAINWLNNGLMRSVVVSGPDAETVWEGFLSSVTAQIGQKPVTLSLEGMANRVRCKYTTVLDTPGTTTSTNDTTSQALYGIKDRIISLAKDIAANAALKASVVLANLAYPKSSVATMANTGDQGQIKLTLSFAGWYATLEWIVFGDNSTTNTSTTTQVGTLLSDLSAINAFIATSTADITASGITATEYVAAGTTYREKIETLLKLGTGVYPLTWGVYEDRTLHVDTWAGTTPDTITYYERIGDSNIYAISGGVVLPWDVRPNAISQVIDLLDIAPVATAPDAAARKYVGRVTCAISGDQIGCTLEPSEIAGIDVLLASMK